MASEPVQLPSGLIVPVADHRQRSLSAPDPLGQPPRAGVVPNANPAVGSVGPNVPVAGDPAAQQGASGGLGATHVLYPQAYPPLEASAWAGWPSEWALPGATPAWGWAQGADLDAAYMCLDLNARVVADMPKLLARGGALPGEEPTYLPPMPWMENPQPQLYTAWDEFMGQVWMSWQGIGEAFILATSRYSDSGLPRTFAMIDPAYVAVTFEQGQRVYRINGSDATDEILHIRYNSWPGDAHGHGPLEVAGARITAAKVLARYGADLAMNGGIPWAVLTHKYQLDPGQAEQIKAQWISAARNRMGAPAILDQDMTLRELQVSPRDMALTELLDRSEARICYLLGVPSYMVGIDAGGGGSNTYANVNSVFVHHWRTTLRTGVRKIYRALSGWLLPYGTSLQPDPDEYIEPVAAPIGPPIPVAATATPAAVPA